MNTVMLVLSLPNLSEFDCLPCLPIVVDRGLGVQRGLGGAPDH